MESLKRIGESLESLVLEQSWNLESLERICESLEETTKGSIYLQIIGDQDSK